MKLKPALKFAIPAMIAVAAGSIAGASVGSSFAGDASPESDRGSRAESHTVSEFEFPVNSAGQTYGSLANSTSTSNSPDLVLVDLRDGSEGYVFAADLFEAENSLVDPASPAEAVRQSQHREGRGPAALDVYDKDGNATGAIWWALTGD